MSKRFRNNNIKYRLVRRYNTDFFGGLNSKGFFVKWSELKQNYKIMHKNIKVIQRRIKIRLLEKLNRRKIKASKKLKKTSGSKKFYYRVDIVKLKPKNKRRSLFAKQLRDRHKIRNFASTMTVRQYKSYIKKAQRSIKLLRKFYQLLENRLDSIIFRMNLSISPSSNRQNISHLSYLINGVPSRSASQQIKFFDIISVKNIRFNFYFLFFRLRRILKFIEKKNKFLSKFKKTIRMGSIFLNNPAYIEVNYRIFSCMIIFVPRIKHLYYPFKFNKRGIPGVSIKFV